MLTSICNKLLLQLMINDIQIWRIIDVFLYVDKTQVK